MSSEEELESAAARGGGRLYLCFTRRADRISQSLECRVGERRIELFVSHEGEAGEAWPPSPPLQQLLIEPRGSEGQVALLVGMAGRSHWSLSVEPVAGRAAFRFDAACRLNAPPTWLGHVWRASETLGRPSEATPNAMSWRIGAGLLAMTGEAASDRESLAPCEFHDGECRIGAKIPEGRFPLTVRWRFTVEWRAS